jgi:tryptophanase
MHTIIEPFRIKMTEALPITSRGYRESRLASAHNNVFLLDAEDITIDLLTDSGTGAMSARQWAALMLGDESYAGSISWHRFENTVREITGFKHIFPVHQGRAAERILAATRLKPGDIVPNNSHFDTTRANIEYVGAKALDLLTPEGEDIYSERRFKGNMDIGKLAHIIEIKGPGNIPFCMITVTDNAGGGQPVSMENIKSVKEMLTKYHIPLVIDACRFAENSYFIKEYEPGFADRSLSEIAREMFALADAATMSAKKDGLANIGGFFGCANDQWAEDFRNMLILTEGFPTYGGLAGRDLEAIAVGLKEALEYEYQRYRHATVAYMADRLIVRKIPIVRPAGGHAVFLDAAAFCPHLEPSDFPGIGARQCALPRRRHSRRGTRQRDVWPPLAWQQGRNPGLARISPARVSASGLYPKSFRLRHRSAGSRLAAVRCDPILQDHKTGAVFTPLHGAFRSRDHIEIAIDQKFMK